MKTLADLHRRNAALHPKRTAFVCKGLRRSYGDYFARILRLGSAIERAGIRRQERIGILAVNSVEYFEIYGACEVGATIAAAYNFRSAAPELAHLLEHSTPALLFFDGSFEAIIESAGQAARAGVRRYVCLGENVPDWATPYEAFLAEGDENGPGQRPRAEDYANLFYTSGTTGRPKGVPYRHDSLLTVAERTSQAEETSLLQITPAFHVGGRCPPLGAMWRAGKSVLQGGFDSRSWLDAVQEERINVTFMVPTMMQAVLDHPELDRYDLSSLEWVMAASTAIPPPLLARAIEKIGAVFYVAYGSTETGGVCRLRRSETRTDGTPEMTARLASVGQAETPVDVRILDDGGNEVPLGQVGEVCVRASYFSGYWNDPAATAEAMHGEFVRTGDLGRFDDLYYLYLVDRRKDMIISGGENIYSREVEDALHRHPAVEAAAVIGVPDPKWGERVMAVLVARPGRTVDEAELIAFCQTQIARYKCPKQIAFVERLPLSGTGKIDKPALRRLHGTAPGST